MLYTFFLLLFTKITCKSFEILKKWDPLGITFKIMKMLIYLEFF